MLAARPRSRHRALSAPEPICVRWQSTWPAKDIFHEFAQRLRQEGQRHDRRRPEDRGAARGRGRAGLRPAGGGVARARSTAATACWPTTTASRRALALWGSGPASAWTPTCCCPAHKYGGGKELLNKLYGLDRRQRGVVHVRPDADPAARLVQAADAPRPRTSRASSSARWASRLTCSPASGPR